MDDLMGIGTVGAVLSGEVLDEHTAVHHRIGELDVSVVFSDVVATGHE